jgi:hypothetical protein
VIWVFCFSIKLEVWSNFKDKYMKQSEKLDIILRYLYERRNDRREFSIAEILKESNVEADDNEIGRLANQLKVDKLIELNVLSQKLKKAKITSKGITYCEEDSHAKKGESIVNHYHIVNSPQSNIVVQSSQVTINQQQHDKATELIKEMREAIGQDQAVDLLLKREILECLTEIEAGVAAQRAPKFAIKGLLGIAANIASISKLALDLSHVVIPQA